MPSESFPAWIGKSPHGTKSIQQALLRLSLLASSATIGVEANPPFNDSDWFRTDDDVRWQFGVPPKGNANSAWVQHSIHRLAPQGTAA